MLIPRACRRDAKPRRRASTRRSAGRFSLITIIFKLPNKRVVCEIVVPDYEHENELHGRSRSRNTRLPRPPRVHAWPGYESLPQSFDALAPFLGFFALGTVVTVGTPVALYLRFRLLGPFGVLLADALFWGVLAGGGDAPGYFFAVALWPVYLGLYLVAAFVEYALRNGSIPSVRTLT